MIFQHKLFSGDYLFVYASDKNNVVVFIHPTPDNAYTPGDDIPDEEVVDTMLYDMLEVMGLKNGKICDDYDSRCR